jgi:death-associated protein kinase
LILLTTDRFRKNFVSKPFSFCCCVILKQENREIYIEQLVPTQDFLRSIKIKVFGHSGVGKTTIIGSLKCSYFGSFFRRTRLSSKMSVSRQKSNESVLISRQVVNPLISNLFVGLGLRFQMSTVDLVHGTDTTRTEHKSGILENYAYDNEHYTRGIEITNTSFSGSNNRHFSIWEYSGYEPYQIVYDHFIGDHNCIHVIVYDLEKSEDECLNQVVYWLEFLLSRIPPKDEIFYKGKCSNAIKCVFIGTHADTDKTCTRNDDGKYTSEKANKIFRTICDTYQHDIDIYNNHFVLDARQGWVPDIKNLINAFNYLKVSQDHSSLPYSLFIITHS